MIAPISPESEARYRAIIEELSELIVRWLPDGSITFMNQACRLYFGATCARLGESYLALVQDERERSALREKIAALTPEQPAAQDVHRALRADRQPRWQEWSHQAIFDRQGQLVEVQSVGRDVHEQRLAEQCLHEAERFNQRLIDVIPSVLYVLDVVDGKNMYFNRDVSEALGYPANELTRQGTRRLAQIMHPEDLPRFREHVLSLTKLQDGQVETFEYRMQHADGSYRWFHSRDTVFTRDSKGTVTEILGVATDLTERRAREDALHEAQRMNEQILGLMPSVLYVYDLEEHKNVLVNREIGSALGRTSDQRALADGPVTALMHPDDQPGFAQHMREMAALPDGAVGEFVYRMGHVNGQWRWFHSRDAVFARDEQRRVKQIIGTATDVTALKEADEAVQASRERYQELAETIDEVFWTSSAGMRDVLYVSPAYEKIWGRSCQSLIESPFSWLEAVIPEDRERARVAAASAAQGRYDEEYRIRRPDGEVRNIRHSGYPVRDAQGAVVRVVGVAQDVTAQRKVEDQLRHLQKMESIGLLAAGIAHDFNNLLTVILGNVELLRMSASVDALNDVERAATRAAELTGQLLLFSRRATMRFQAVDVNTLIGNLTKMLARILGEDVQLQLQLAEDLPAIQADPGMIEQVIVNLAVNARDAMPNGGRLRLSTSEQTVTEGAWRRNPESAPGRHVCLSVADTGVGIAPGHLPKIFEPFFTTKEVGKGTGLGLATAYGIVKQHGGWIEVKSTVKHGTSFEIHLPVGAAKRVEKASEPPPAARSALTGSEQILLVEDDAAVRDLAANVLRMHGYRVHIAASGLEACKLWKRQRDQIDLVVTDMVMPGGMTGADLATVLRKDRPGLQVIFMSGYARDWDKLAAAATRRDSFLPKPYSNQQLLELVRKSLASTEQRARSDVRELAERKTDRGARG